MDFKELKTALAQEAKEKGICNEWHEYIKTAPNKERLLTLFVKGLDFVLINGYPSQPLRAEFADIRQHYGIFMGKDLITAKHAKKVMAFDKASGTTEYNGYDVGEVWAREKARLHVVATGNAYVCVDVANEAFVAIDASGSAKVTVFVHGGEYCYEATEGATIKVIDKRKEE